jgi:hypothetical protein
MDAGRGLSGHPGPVNRGSRDSARLEFAAGMGSARPAGGGLVGWCPNRRGLGVLAGPRRRLHQSRPRTSLTKRRGLRGSYPTGRCPRPDPRAAALRRDTAPTDKRVRDGGTNRAGRARAPAGGDRPCPAPGGTGRVRARTTGTPRPGAEQRNQTTWRTTRRRATGMPCSSRGPGDAPTNGTPAGQAPSAQPSPTPEN